MAITLLKEWKSEAFNFRLLKACKILYVTSSPVITVAQSRYIQIKCTKVPHIS